MLLLILIMMIQRNQSIKNNQQDAHAYFYLGGIYGFRGQHKVRKRDQRSVFKGGLNGIYNLKKTTRIDTLLYDAYYGLDTLQILDYFDLRF